MQHDPSKDPDERDALENLKVVEDYVRRTTHWQEGRPDRHDAIQALGELYDQIDWIEKGIIEWRGVAHAQSAIAKQEAAKTRVVKPE